MVTVTFMLKVWLDLRARQVPASTAHNESVVDHVSATDSHHVSWLNPFQRAQNLWNEFAQRLDAIVRRRQRDDRKRCRRPMVASQATVDGDEDVELPHGEREQPSVLEARPAALRDRSDGVPNELSSDLTRQTFIEEDAHWPSTLLPRARVPQSPAHA